MVKRHWYLIAGVLILALAMCQSAEGQRVPLTGQPTPPPGGGGGAPTTAEYLVGLLDGTLTAERLVTNTATITWDLSVAGQAKANATGVVTTVTGTAPIASSGGTTPAISLNNDGVTYAKMQNVSAASRLLGRGSAAGAGDPEEIILGTNLSMSGTTLNASGSGTTPTGTGFRHVVGGVEDAAAKLVDTADVNADQITYPKIQNVSATSRFLGRITAGAGDIEELTGTQSTTLLDLFTSALKGLVPGSGGGTTNFLRADGTWAAPPGGGSGDNVRVNGTDATNADLEDTTPAADAGGDGTYDGLNVKWQKDSGAPDNISAYVGKHPNGEWGVGFSTVGASAVNYPGIQNALSGSSPHIAARGTDANISLGLTPKGTGVLCIGDCSVGSPAQWIEQTAPGTPAANKLHTYAKDKAGVSNLYYKDDAGVEHDLGAETWTTVKKTADEVINSDATLSSDALLKFTTTANTQYHIRVRVIAVPGNASADFKYRMTHAGTTTRVRRVITRTVAGATSATYPTVIIATAFDAADVALVAAVATDLIIYEDIILQVGAAGGELAFQWAQNTSTAGANTTVFEGSYLEYTTM